MTSCCEKSICWSRSFSDPKKKAWAWVTLRDEHYSKHRSPSVTHRHTHTHTLTEATAHSQPYITAPSCLKTIWKLLGLWSLTRMGFVGFWRAPRLTESALLAAIPPRSRYPQQTGPACDPLGAECGRLRGVAEAHSSMAESNVYIVMGQM